MKKKVKCMLWVIMIIGILAIAGCKKEAPSENQFDAKILEVTDEYLMVEALEGQTIAGEVQVWTGLLSEKDIPELKEGVIVRITHDGKMTMSLPPQMSAVEEIVILLE